MWRTIIRGCERQFQGQMDLECRHYLGVSIRQIREILDQFFDIHDLDEPLADDESVFTQPSEPAESQSGDN